MPFGPSGETPFDHGCAPLLPAWLKALPRRVQSLGRAVMRKFQEVGFARRTGGVTADISASDPEVADVERANLAGIPPPSTLQFRTSDLGQYSDLFTRAPLVREPTRQALPSRPAQAIVREEPLHEHRLPINEHLRLATPRPTVSRSPALIPPPPGAHYDDAGCGPTPPSSNPSRVPTPTLEQDSYPVSRLIPTESIMKYDGFVEPARLFILKTAEGEIPPLIPLRAGIPISVVSLLREGELEQLWPVEAIRFEPESNRAIIIASYDGFATPVIVPFDIIMELPTRARVWRRFRDELADVARTADRYALDEDQVRGMHEEARARAIWEITKSVSGRTVPPLQHPAPSEVGLHIVRTLGMFALPGPQ
ncbi:hypothetical protein GGF50DRAFT_67654 [Schizophyllum commune]